MPTAVELTKKLSPDWSKELARRLLRAYGSVTADSRPLPDYLIIGTKRGGTTSLWKALLQHPEVLSMFPAAENLKSPHYFDIHWSAGLRWYRSHFPTDRARRRVSGSRRRVTVGEASPYYMFHPLAAERVVQTIPGVRVIALLRNPTDRAYSHYRERRHEGTESLGFAAALAAEERRLNGEVERIRSQPDYYSRPHDFCSYLARGRYLEQLEPWLELVDPAHLLVLRSEDLYARPDEVLRSVHAFLGLSEQPQTAEVEHMNRLPGPVLDAGIRRRLDDYYRPHVLALEARLGRSFDWNI